MNKDMNDDGTLSFLNIPPGPERKRFNCDTITQQKLINREFWVIDYFEHMKTKFGDDRILVKIKFDLKDSEDKAYKFFTNSEDIKYILRMVKDRDAFPRRVTMKANGNRYYIE